ncbi:translational activator of GCN4 [Knufia obscura]|uniref:Translational activator of GCN4 n=1 Tax=Knufia obscura TaxID=1635080 RepID=A0ABR0RNI3_9EURO|nr:translational activator of GCN4 [Knufia obscura]
MENGVDEVPARDSLEDRVQEIQSSSTNRQTDLLRTLLTELEDEAEAKEEKISQDNLAFLPHLLATYPRQFDRQPRKLVQSCLRVYLRSDTSGKLSAYLGNFLLKESQKAVVATSNAFVLLEWCTVVEEELAKLDNLNEALLRQTCTAQALLLDKCLAPDTRSGIMHTALIISRRGLRKLFQSKHSEAALNVVVKELTSASSTTANAGLIGVVAGVSVRLPKVKPLFEAHVSTVLDWYTKVVLGSKTVLPEQQVHGLDEFFTRFATSDTVEKTVVPTIEKGILRSPENVLRGPIPALAESLPTEIDISQQVAAKLLKPLLSSLASTNANVRVGAAQSLSALLIREQDAAELEKIVKDLLSNVKSSKAASYELRGLICDSLKEVKPAQPMSVQIVQGLLPIAAKEANESALRREVAAIAAHTSFLLSNGLWSKDMTDPIVKGCAEKRAPFKKLWLTGTAVALLNLTEVPESGPGRDLVMAVLNAAADAYVEISPKPLPAATAGTISMAYIVPALVQHSVLGPLLKSTKAKLAPDATGLQLTQQSSFLLNPQVYTKLSAADDQKWALHALLGVDSYLANAAASGKAAWGRALLHLLLAPESDPQTRKTTGQELAQRYLTNPAAVGSSIVLGIWGYLREEQTGTKKAKTEDAPTHLPLRRAVASISPTKSSWSKRNLDPPQETLHRQAISTVVLYGPDLIPSIEWVSNLLAIGVDPGSLAASRTAELMREVLNTFESAKMAPLSVFERAACRAASTLTFVAPDHIGPVLVRQIKDDLDASQLSNLGPTEATIARMPEGVLVVDPLAKTDGVVENKNVKDYETLKWEEELKTQLAKKKGAPQKKLTPDQQAKVDAQMKHEKEVRERVHALSLRLRRGAGFVHALAVGPPTEARLWISSAINALAHVLEAGGSFFVDDELIAAYLVCSNYVTDRLGALRPFIGVATLRALHTVGLPTELEVEPLEELAMRVLYRLRFASEQRPFDTPSLAYSLPLIFAVLDNGKIGKPASAEDADAQVLLALEFLSFQMSSCSDEHLPRAEILRRLFFSMQRYPQHYRLIKDSVLEVSSAVAANITDEERDVLLHSTTLADASARSAALQAINEQLDLSDMDYSVHIWLACQDAEEDNANTALEIWEESEFKIQSDLVDLLPAFLNDRARSTRTAAAKALAQALMALPEKISPMRTLLQTTYQQESQPLVPKADKRGIVQRGQQVDPWEKRSGLALAFQELATVLPKDDLLAFMDFLVSDGALSDRNATVRQEMTDAGTAVVTKRGKETLEPMMSLFEKILQGPNDGSEQSDWVQQAVIVLYGSVARHLPAGDPRLKKVLEKLVNTLSTPSESVQYAVANCLPPLVRAAGSDADSYFPTLLDQLFQNKNYGVRRGAAYGVAGMVKGKGIAALRQFRIMSALRAATEDKKSADRREGAMMGYELLSSILGRTFEPYVVDVLPQLLACFGDPSANVREACLHTAKACFASLSSFGVHKVLPQLLEGLDETQWRSKKGACDLLGAMAYLDPQQLAQSLPDIIPPLTEVLTDSHKEVRAAANSSLKRFGEVISNPEVKSLVDILLKALSDPTKYTEDALDGLIRVSFIHYLDSPSLALIVRIIERGLNDRSSTKRKAAQIIGSLAHLTEKRDIVTHLPILVSGLRLAAIDPVPATRATASKALGSLVEKLGEDAFPDLIPSLMGSLRTDTGASDRLGSAQALSEVLAGLGTMRLEETLPTILQNVASARAVVREGFMTLFIFLPACFGNSFANYLAQIIPSVLSGLADDVEAIRETALRAGRLLVKNFATKSIDLLLPELQRGLADNSYRIRLSSVELVGDLLFNLTGITANAEADEDDDTAAQAGQSLLEVLGEERRNRVLSSLYICRCDTSGLVRTAAVAVWKALVATPRTLRDIVPTLTQMIIVRLGSTNAEQKHIAANALGEVIRKSGEGIFTSLLPTLEDGLQTSTDADNRQGICIALREVITAASPDSIEDNEKKIIGILRTALVDNDEDVREAAAEAFDALQAVIGKRAVDQVLPHLLNLLRSDDEAENALSALLTLLTEQMRANAILPNLIPTLLTTPISAFNARALASLAKVGGAAMNRRIPTMLNNLADNIISCKDDDRMTDLETAFDAVLCSVDEFDGLNTAMSVMLQMIKHDDHNRRAIAATHLAAFFNHADVDYSRYNQDLIRVLLISFDDRDKAVVSAAWTALSALQTHLRKEEMESLTTSTTTIMKQVGTPGHNLPGFMLPKGIQPVLAIFLQGLMNGTTDQRLQAANGISDMIDKSAPESLKPFVTQITGPLIRVVGERSIDVKTAIIHALNQLLDKIPAFLRPFLPQLQRTFTKCIADPTSDVLRTRAIRALSTLITLTPRIDPLITELTTGAKTTDTGVRNAMLKALQEVVSKVGANMSEASRDAILGLMDSQNAEADEMVTVLAKLLGSMVKVLPAATANQLIKQRVLIQPATPASILALNAVLAENAKVLTDTHLDEARSVLQTSLANGPTYIQHNAVLAIGKLLLISPDSNDDTIISDTAANKPLIDTLASKIKQGNDIDTRRLSLVVIRTLSRRHNTHMRPYIPTLLLPVYQSLRDPVIPIKLAAEACFIQLFDVVESESAVFDEVMGSEGMKREIPPQMVRAIGEYMKRVGLKLGGQKREQREAEGGVRGNLGLGSDEVEDEREVWSVGRVEVEGGFGDD